MEAIDLGALVGGVVTMHDRQITDQRGNDAVELDLAHVALRHHPLQVGIGDLKAPGAWARLRTHRVYTKVRWAT